MRAVIVGDGKMGREIQAALIRRSHSVLRMLGPGGSFEGLGPATVDVALEFTEPPAARANCEALLSLGVPVVCGTTGWDPEPTRWLARERKVGFLHAPNFSVGVAAARRAAAAAARMLAPFREFEPAILERHHSAKKDAPSGTAKLLAATVREAAGRQDEVPVVALRQGGQPGEHVVFFEGADETVEVVHRARSRALFAVGAVAAAEWLVRSAAGRAGGPATFDEFLDALSAGAGRSGK